MSEAHDARDMDGVLSSFEALEVDNVYQRFESFGFEENRAFQDGLKSLQKNQRPSNNINADDADRLMQMKIFFYNRFVEPIDLTGYRRWSSGCSAVYHHGTTEARGTTESHLSPSQPQITTESHLSPSHPQRHMDNIEQSLTPCPVSQLSLESPTTTQHSLESNTNAQHSLESNTTTQHSLESNTTTQHSLESPTNARHSLESNTTTQHSLESSRTTQHSLESNTTTQHSLESPTNARHSLESNTTSQHSLESNTTSQHSLESNTTTHHSLESCPVLSFAEVMRLVQAGLDVPGVSRVDIEPSNLNPTPSQLTRRLKPWET